MIILDANAVSELLIALPNPLVLQCIEKQAPPFVHTTVFAEAELRFGAAIMAAGKRMANVAKLIDETLREDFPGRIFAV